MLRPELPKSHCVQGFYFVVIVFKVLFLASVFFQAFKSNIVFFKVFKSGSAFFKPPAVFRC